MRLFFKLFLFFNLMNVANSEVQIEPYKKKYYWKSEWSEIISKELENSFRKEEELSILNKKIDNESLKLLNCESYNDASKNEKINFWIVFFSALTRAESAFNEKAKSKISRGHRSLGLLQLSPITAKNKCKMENVKENILNPYENLKCGVTLLTWQLNGAPVSAQKKIRPDLENKIFGKNMFQWGPLRSKDKTGRKLLLNWFKKHLNQLDFCKNAQ